MLQDLPVIFYGYTASPYAVKLQHILFFKNIPHSKVKVSPILPRPELSDLLGIAYRRIPILAIGNDVYCDSNLIAAELERRFPDRGTLFPPRKQGGKVDSGLIKLFSQHYVDLALFPQGVSLLPWGKFPENFIKDRSEFQRDLRVERLKASQNVMLSTVASHLTLLEEQLSDEREWLLDTTTPSLADISLYFMYFWIPRLPAAKGILDPNAFPNTIKWLDRLAAIFHDGPKPKSAPFKNITGAEAARLIADSPHQPYNFVGLDATEAARLGVKAGDTVSVVPTDSGQNHPTIGKLVGLNREQVVIEVQGSTKAVVRCHFPRLGFSVSHASSAQSKL